MDSIRPQLIKTERVKEIFSNVRYRLFNERIKTNEVYIEILIDEINKFFNDLSTSTIDTTVLPSNKKGPSVDSHNNLIINTVTDIDKVNDKKNEIQSVITKAVNYLSTERLSINDMVSKLENQIINQKIRLSSNNRNITVFTEYFSDNTFQNIQDSTNVIINKEIGALTLSPLFNNNNDNNESIDIKSIELRVELQDDEVKSHNKDRIYPLSNVIGEHSYYKSGLGRSLSKESIDNKLINYLYAGINESDGINNIKTMAIQPGIVDEYKDEAAEFEFILNKFDDILFNAIEVSIKNSKLNDGKLDIDTINNIIIDDENGYSFNDSKNTGSQYTSNSLLLTDTIKEMGLYFKINNIKGIISYISILFHPIENSVDIPYIDYRKSYVKDSNGKVYKAFIEPKNTTNNTITERKNLLLNNIITDIKEIYIAFDVSKMNIVDISKYNGMVWKVPVNKNSIIATVDSQQVIANTIKYIYIYHDLKRGEDYINKNKEILNKIINKYKNDSIITGEL